MKCPFCGEFDSRVLDTRIQKEGEVTRRRRECIKCKGRFSTQESYMLNYPFILKKDGRREPFMREKILKGVQAACQKRPISLSQMENIVDQISYYALNQIEKEVPSSIIGEKVMLLLKNLDNVAYVRFASVYRNFHDINDFFETLKCENHIGSSKDLNQINNDNTTNDVNNNTNNTKVSLKIDRFLD